MEVPVAGPNPISRLHALADCCSLAGKPSLIREAAMATNMALKRAAKANRRKAVLAEKRKSESVAATLPEQVRRAASTPIQFCLLTEGLLQRGSGVMVLARGITTDHLGIGVFLLDSFCMGIKNVIFGRMGGQEFEAMIGTLEAEVAQDPVEPSYARKLLRDLAIWAQAVGFAPATDFAVVERLFGDVSAEACDMAFQFGREGKPFYIQGLSDSPAQVLRRLEMVRTYIRKLNSSA
jgi:hypothetical protein